MISADEASSVRSAKNSMGTPLAVAGVVALIAVVLLGARTAVVCDNDIGCLVVAGEQFTDPAAVPIPVEPGPGYDGQFFYRQARSPLDFALEASNGVRFDTEVRPARIGYPLTVWAISGGGQPAAVPYAMALVNIASLAAVGFILALAARQAGRTPWWGLLAAAVPGALFASGRLLADPFSAAVIGGAALLLVNRRWGWAAALLGLGVLTKEQAVIVPLAYGLTRLWSAVGERRFTPVAADLPWLVPGAVFVMWQATLVRAVGAAPAAESGGLHVVWPGADLLPAMISWLRPSGASEALWLIEIVAFVALAVLVAASRSCLPWQRVVAVLSIVLVSVLSDFVFADPTHFRQISDLTVVLLIAAFQMRSRWWVAPVALNVVASSGVAVRLVDSL